MSASARRIAQACLIVLLLSSNQLRADEPGSSPALTPAESEYIALAEEFNKRLEDAKKKGGLAAFLKERDGPFQPEPFGPRAKKKTE